MKRKGYKVVYVIADNLFSAWYRGLSRTHGGSHAIARYSTIYPTCRKKGNGPLTVFKNHKDAIRFRDHIEGSWVGLHDYSQIYSCTYTPTRLKTRKLWHTWESNTRWQTLDWKGTALADSVQLKNVRA